MPLYNAGVWTTAIYRALIEGLPCVIERKFSVSRFRERIKQFGCTQTFTSMVWRITSAASTSTRLGLQQLEVLGDGIQVRYS